MSVGSPSPDPITRALGTTGPRRRPPEAVLLPAQQPEEANGDVLLWVREEFLNYIDLSGRLVIHGHTPFKSVRVLQDKIGIDTGAVFGGVLTALQMPERKLYQSDGRRVIETDLPEPPRLEDIT